MADYNVQMKQFNGTSFDNILPYASQALTLAGGGGATEIIAQARAGLSQIATGSYVGTGVYTNPTEIVMPFKPKLMMLNGVYSTRQDYAGWLWVNGVHQDWNNFDAAYISGVSTVASNISGMQEYSGISVLLIDKPIVISVRNNNPVFNQIVIELKYESGVCKILQTQYSSSNGNKPTELRTAKAQYNSNGAKYYWAAFS